MSEADKNWSGGERRALDGVTLILHRLDTMEKQQQELHTTMAKLAESMTRLALAEERIAQVNDALGRAFKAIDKQGETMVKLQEAIDSRLDTLEKSAPLNNQARTWVFGGVIALAAAACMYVGFHTGLVEK